MYRRIALFILVGFSVSPVMAQQRLRVAAAASIMSSPGQSPGTGNVYYANRNEPPRAIEFKERKVTSSYFVANIHQYLNIPNEFTFIEAESNTDHLGMHHRLLQQYYKGIPLEGMGYRIHEVDGFMRSANGKAVRDINLDSHVILSEQQAFQLAIKYLNTKDTTIRQGNKLIVSKNFTFAPESFSIAFQFDIVVSFIERWRISIDARNGEVINKVNLVNICHRNGDDPSPYGTGSGLSNYYGTKTFMIEKFANGYSRLGGQTNAGVTIATYDFRNKSVMDLLWHFSDGFDIYSSDTTYNGTYYKPAVSVQWGVEQAYDYYLKKHNRNSFNNIGSAIRSYVHVDNNYNNAIWTGSEIGFGDGSNNNPLVELDVVSHEFTHGVTQYEAALQYYMEPGALNESFSDIMGKAIEFSVFGNTATWQIAKHYRDGGLRNFSNPNLQNQPDTYGGDMWYTGYEDGGGVHYNSGVQNFWFYLLCEGGSGVNDKQISYSVKSIGIDTAANIVYRNLTEYLTYFSDYLDSRIGSMLAAADLYGKNSFAYQQVDKAWDAVGVINEPIITSLTLYDITATTVKIKGALQPRGDTVTYYFEYGTTPTFGSSSSIYKYTDKIEGIVTGLQSETKYYLRIVAINENGRTNGSTTEFTTISLAPLVKIKDAGDVTETTATFRGQINPNSLPISFYFEYGTTPSFGQVTSSYPMPDTTEFLNVSVPVINLQSRQTYYYRLIATNGFASSTTESAHFFTGVKPIITSYSPITAPIGTEVTITGQNFNSISEKNVVNFGATRGVVLSSSPTEIKVKVPAGASLRPISVLDTESGLAAESVQEFVPTFTGDFKRGDLQLRVGIMQPYIWKTCVEDIDGDSKPDIVSIHYQGFSVFQNVNQGGDITNESFVRNTFNVPDFRTSSDFQVVDLDGNGLKDIVARSQNGLRIYPNFSVPGYIFFGVPVDLAVENLRSLIYSDFDLDGRIDIAGIGYVSGDSSLLTILKNQNPKGSLSANNFEQQYTKILPYYVYFMTSGDLNNDNKPDLMMGAFYGNFLSIQKNNSHARAIEFDEVTVPDSARGRFVKYTSHDFNQDGWQDIASHSPYEKGNLAIMENKGTSPNITLAEPAVALNENVQSIIKPGDINGDGKIDLLVGFDNRRFVFLENKTEMGEHLSNSTFQKFEEYGMPLINAGSGTVDTRMTINDLNGDGRPEVINAYSYNYGPHEGYQMEIWQNSSSDCLDPSLISVMASNYTATIVLPPNTTFDQFEIEYGSSTGSYWQQAYSTTLYNLSPGYSYQLRARAKCYLDFTNYYYINFTPDCVNTSSFFVSDIGVDNVFLNASNLYLFEVQYSLAGKNQWQYPQYSNQIINLLPGTTYDIRFRGKCNTPVEYNHLQFTTLCPNLSSINITTLSYNKAGVSWTSNYTSKVILEYSADNLNWTSIDESLILAPLTPGKTYYVRGKMYCTNINSDFVYTSFTTLCPTVSALGADSVMPNNAKINWVDESNTGGYTLTYRLTTGGAKTTVETSSTSFNLEGLSPGAQYTVSVAPYCIAAKSFTTFSFRTTCYVPFDLLAQDITHTSAEISWKDHFSDLPYSVDYSIAGSGVWKTTVTASMALSMEELRPGTRYEVRVHFNCLSETAPYVSLFFETDLYLETTIAPNPTNSVMTIYPSKNLIGKRFSIHDSAGKQVASGELFDYTIDLSAFYTGIYIIKIDDEKPIKVVKY